MDILRDIFTNPNNRPFLEQYYEAKLAAAREQHATRQASATHDAHPKTQADSSATPQTAFTPLALSLDKLASFDDWLAFQQTFHTSDPLGSAAQSNFDALAEQHPDTISNVAYVFSSKGQCQAYIDNNGMLITANAHANLSKIAEAADELGLSGRARINYLAHEVSAALSATHSKLEVEAYAPGASPSKREFHTRWAPDFDIDSHFNQQVLEARSALDQAKARQDQRLAMLYDMQSFLLTLHADA